MRLLLLLQLLLQLLLLLLLLLLIYYSLLLRRPTKVTQHSISTHLTTFITVLILKIW
jgi:hypothetical protein